MLMMLEVMSGYNQGSMHDEAGGLKMGCANPHKQHEIRAWRDTVAFLFRGTYTIFHLPQRVYCHKPRN